MKQELIVKSNVLLQQPLYRTSIELKIFSRIILAIRSNPESNSHTFYVKSLLEIFEIGFGNYGELKRIAKSMFRVVDLNPGKEEFHLSAVFTDIFIHEEGLITFKVNTEVKPHLLNLTSNFTQYYFENIARMKSSFSIRIYELLKQYESIGSRKENLIYLRKCLNIGKDKFSRYNDFKRKVILTAQKELKEKADICFEFEEIKTGRKITDINFIIVKNVKTVEESEVGDSEQETLTEEQAQLKVKLIEYGITEKVVNELILDVSAKQIEQNIFYTQKEHGTGKVKNNFSGYLLKAIKNNYAGNLSLFEEEEKKKKAEAQKQKYLEEQRKSLAGKLSKKFDNRERDNFIESLTEEQKQALLDEVLEGEKMNSFLVSGIKKTGLKSPFSYSYIIKKIDNFTEKKEAFIAEGLKKEGFN